YALGHHYGFGEHKAGRTNIWENFQKARAAMPDAGPSRGGIGTPDTLRAHLRKFADAGVDQVTFIQQGGRNRHEHICESLELFASDVMPEFHAAEAERQRKKQAELAPFIAQAFERKQWMKELRDEEIPTLIALGRQVAEGTAPR
ncbi:MAG TPA: LLM class flavin-dependent oxidoreductase, partial [Myxococcota bacterium]|nr:LLM class flavin-dependent oxidoreductase [Myxococcota bacterium]